jgi:hypothetical protein
MIRWKIAVYPCWIDPMSADLHVIVDKDMIKHKPGELRPVVDVSLAFVIFFSCRNSKNYLKSN